MAYCFSNKEERVEDAASQAINVLVGLASDIGVMAVESNDQDLAQRIVANLEASDGISCVMLSSASMVSDSQHNCSGEPYAEYFLTNNTGTLGKLIVYSDFSYFDALVREEIEGEINDSIKLIVMICALILLMTYKLITQPVVVISDRLSRVRFDEEIDLLNEGARGDELGNIGRVINLMMVNAKKQIIREKILSRRTKELSSSFKLIFELSKNYLAVTDNTLRLKSFNPQFGKLVSYTKGELPLIDSDNWIEHVCEDPERLRKLFNSVDELNVPTTTQIECSYNNGDELVHNFFSLTFVKSNTDTKGITVLVFINDITEQHRKLLETEYEANHDNLTKLYNRLAATRRIRHLLSARLEQEQIAIVFIDLDGFKKINDTYGHDAGDNVLRAVATRIKKAIRLSDVACRWGGDEFLVAFENVSVKEAEMLTRKILGNIVEPIHIRSSSVELSIGASIGLALSSNKVSDFSTLYDQADRAMYKVKKSSKNAILTYSELS